MTTTSEPQSGGFRLSQLLYDTRYRSITIQVVALGLLVMAVWWLVSNTVQNLEALGKDFDFGFLAQPASYDINQRLIEYDSRSSHGRAAVVGMLNTILIAVLGCIAATILGVIAGVLRLSKNWIVRRIVGVYVEGFRNIPLLLWIVLIFAVVSESLPIPRAFGSGEAQLWLGSVAMTRQGTWIPAPVWGEGSGALVAVFLLSILAIWVFRRYAARRQAATGQILPVLWISLALLVLPTLIAFYVLGRPVTLDYPVPSGFNFDGGVLSAIRSSRCGWRSRSIPAPSSPKSSAAASSPSPRARPRPPLPSGCVRAGR